MFGMHCCLHHLEIDQCLKDGQVLPKSVDSFEIGNGFPDQNEFKMKFGVACSVSQKYVLFTLPLA